MIISPGSTQVSVDVFFADDNGAAVTGKVAADFPACKWSNNDNTADTAITLSDLTLITTAHPNDNTAGGIKEREGGWYRLDLPNNMFSGAGEKTITFAETTNKRILTSRITCRYIQSDLRQMGGVSQSATDLKDFADTGYDPATHKVVAVATADALTANNDKTGYALSAAGVQAIWDALTSALTTVGSIGKRIVDYLGGGSKVAATVATGDGTDSATLLTRLTAARAGYLDNLNVGGPVASHADILAINQSASKHLLVVTVGQYERPESSSVGYTIEVRTFSAIDGSAVNADSTPTLTPTGSVSGNLSANLSPASSPGTGIYRWTYTVASNATLEQIRMDVSATISGSTFTLSAYTQVTDFVAATWTATDSANLTAIFNKLPVNNIADETLVLAAVSGVQADVTTLLGRVTATLFSGVTSLANWLGIIAGKTADASTLAEVHATPAGATYNNVTQSLETINGGGGGGGGGGTDPLTNVPGFYAAGTLGALLGDIVNGEVTVTSPAVSNDGTFTIVVGDDYTAAGQGAIVFSIATPDLTGYTAMLSIARPNRSAISFSGTILNAGLANQAVSFDLISGMTSLLASGSLDYQIHLVDPVTLKGPTLTGICRVIARVG